MQSSCDLRGVQTVQTQFMIWKNGPYLIHESFDESILHMKLSFPD